MHTHFTGSGFLVPGKTNGSGIQSPFALEKKERFLSSPLLHRVPQPYLKVLAVRVHDGYSMYRNESVQLFYETGEVCFSGRAKIQTQVSTTNSALFLIVVSN